VSINDKLYDIQQKLKAPKSQFNDFAKFPYRNCEDILEAVKPLLNGAIVLLSDEIILVGDRVYVKATATLREGEESISVSANAREALTKKGMDDSQITGSTSSYARKYALNGLFLIDDTKDADSQDNKEAKSTPKKPPIGKREVTSNDLNWIKAIKSGASKLEDLDDPDYRQFIKDNLRIDK